MGSRVGNLSGVSISQGATVSVSQQQERRHPGASPHVKGTVKCICPHGLLHLSRGNQRVAVDYRKSKVSELTQLPGESCRPSKQVWAELCQCICLPEG